MKTMKRLLALLLALAMVMPNCLTIASAYDEEVVEEVVEELAEEIPETAEEEVEEVYEEVFEEEIFEEEAEEEVAEEVMEPIAVITDNVAASLVAPEVTVQVITSEDSYDSEKLFADHAISVLYPNGPVTMGTNGFDELGEQEQALYGVLAAAARKIANGKQSSTLINLDLPFAVDMDQAELVLDAMLRDMPHILYWYGNTMRSYGTAADNLQAVDLSVASVYATGDPVKVTYADGSTAWCYFNADTEKTGKVMETVKYAQEVATTEAFQKYGPCETAYDKLMAYVSWISNKVEYDYTAAAGGNQYYSTENCDPWQIIYVFDNDENTNVVCEGYSKALQYLCDIATDMDIPHVFSVTGNMYNLNKPLEGGGYEGGAHMWNIAVMDGQNYLVDVTNHDVNSGGFILLGGNHEDAPYEDINGNVVFTALRHTFKVGSVTMAYDYDQETMNIYKDDLSEITLAEEDYSATVSTGSSSKAIPVYNEEDLASKLETANNDGGTVVVRGNVEADSVSVGLNATLVVEAGATLTVTNMDIYGTVKVAGTLVNNFAVTMWNQGKLNVTGNYSGTGNVCVTTYGEALPEISGVPKANKYVQVRDDSDDAAASEVLLEQGLSYAKDYGKVEIVLYSNAGMEELEIPENVTLILYDFMTIDRTLTNHGTVEIGNGGMLQIESGSSVTNNGTVNIAPIGDLTRALDVNWTGNDPVKDYNLNQNVQLQHSTALNNGENPINVTAELFIPDGVTLTLKGHMKLSGNGKITVENGGTLLVGDGGKLVVADGCTVENYGTVFVDGGEINGQEGAVSGPNAPIVNGGSEEGGDDQVSNYMSQEELEAALEENDSWVHESYTMVENGTLTINKDFYLDDYGTIVVPDGATLVLDAYTKLIGGNIFVHQGGTLVLKGKLDIMEGTVFVDNYGETPAVVEFDGGWVNAGSITYATIYDDEGNEINGAAPYISANHVHHNGMGWYVNNIDHPEMRSISMPNTGWYVIFFLNTFNYENHTWERTPLSREELRAGNNVVLRPVSDYEWEQPAPGYEDLFPYFVEISYGNPKLWDADTWVEYEYNVPDVAYEMLRFPIRVERNQEHGFYSAPEASNGTWLNYYYLNPMVGVPELYYIFTDPNNTITDAQLVRGSEIVESFQRLEGTNTWKITLKQDVVDNIWKNGDIKKDIEVEATVTDGHTTWTTTQNTWGEIWRPHEHAEEMSMGMLMDAGDGLFEYRYYAKYGWMRFTDNGPEVTDVEKLGISYSAETSTLTFNGINVKGIHLRGYGGDRMTLELEGENNITTGMEAFKAMDHLDLTIVDGGNGVLNLNGTDGSSIDVDPSSKLTLKSSTINANARLMFGGVVTIDGAIVNAKGEIHVDNELNLNSGALNTTAVGRVDPHKDHPDVLHTHYESIMVAPQCRLNVNGGALKVTIPDNATTDSVFFHGISLQQGNLNINGGTVTIDAAENMEGFGIKLGWIYGENDPIEGTSSNFSMSGGKLIMKEAMFQREDASYAQPHLIWDEGGAMVTVNGGEWELNAVTIELNGTTVWNDGTVTGKEIEFTAGGESFTINGGEFQMGGAPFNKEMYSTSIFRAAGGNVVMNGGTMNIENGVLGVPGNFELNGGKINITNEEYKDCWGVVVPAGVMTVAGGELTVSVPGGVDPRDSESKAPAMQVDNFFKQTGGTVTLTSDDSAAIRSYGTVEQTGGIMNLSGEYGVGQFAEGTYQVSGGVLNIDAANTGIFASDSTVRIVKGMNDREMHVSDPTVTIEADGAAIQMLSTEYRDNIYVCDYTFVDADGNELIMNELDGREIEKYQCYVYTLIKSGTTGESQDDYATYAKIEPAAEVIKTQDEWDALVGSISDYSRNIRIEGDITISGREFRLRDNAEMTIANGAKLTLQSGSSSAGTYVEGSLTAKDNSKITVQSGGTICNESGLLAADMGSIIFEKGSAFIDANGEVGGRLNVHYRNNTLAQVTGIETQYQTLMAYISNMDQYEKIMGMAFDADGNNIYSYTNVFTEGNLTIDRTETLKAPLMVSYGHTLTIAENAIVVIPAEGRLTANYNTNLMIHGKLKAEYGARLQLNSSKVTVGRTGELVNYIGQRQENGEAEGSLYISGTTINVMGKLTNRGYMDLDNGAILTINGEMVNDGFLMLGKYGNGVQLNVNGTLNSKNPILVGGEDRSDNDAQINISRSGVVNVNKGDINNHGLIVVSGALNVNQDGYLNQNGSLAVTGSVNLRAGMDLNGWMALQSDDNGSGRMVVHEGARLDLMDSGHLIVDPGAILVNNGNTIIRIGTLYLKNGGRMDGSTDGFITRENGRDFQSTDNYLSYYRINYGPDGWQMNLQDNPQREIRVCPGYSATIVCYENIWDEENLRWERRRFAPNIESNEYLEVTWLQGRTDDQFADSEDGHGFVQLVAKPDSWNWGTKIEWGGLTMPLFIGRNQDHGFYSKPEATDENWLETIRVNQLAENVQDLVVYYMVTNPNVQMSYAQEGSVDLSSGLPGVRWEFYQDKPNTLKITIPGSSIKSMTDNAHLQVMWSTTTPGNRFGYGTSIQPVMAHNIPLDVVMRIDGWRYGYNAKYDKWTKETQNGPVFSALPDGLSYDYKTNTLTMEDAHLTSLELSCYGWDGQNLIYNEKHLPNENLNLKLIGDNSIECDNNSALRISTGVKLNITGDGSLYLLTDNGDGSWYEWEQRYIPWSALDICMEGSELTLSGNAKVTAELKGANYENGTKENKQHGHAAAISGNGHNRTLTIKGNAVLTTVLPKGVNRDDDIGGTGGYAGLRDFDNIVIKGGTLNTQTIDVRSYKQSGGTVNITGLPKLQWEENFKWNEEQEKDVPTGTFREHTHTDGIYTNGGNVEISGGALNITIPAATKESSWYRGIAMDSGKLTISKDAVVTIDGPANQTGNGIDLSCGYDVNGPVAGTFTTFNMSGGKLVMKEALTTNYDLTTAIWGDGNAVVNVTGGEWILDAVRVDLNGKTTWNGGKVNGEEILFRAGGEKFVIDSGEFTMNGQTIEGIELISNSEFVARGNVTMNGGKINLNGGMLAVENLFELQGGEINITNKDVFARCNSLVVKNYMPITGGKLTIDADGAVVQYEDEKFEICAAMIDGCLHQQGGEVSITSTTTEAIRSNGSVLLNDGVMNLSGQYGIQQFGQGDKEFYVSGGELNIDAADTGIYAEYSNVRFVPFDENDEEIPKVTINADKAAIQVVTGSETENGIDNAYAFYNADGKLLSMKAKKIDHKNEETGEEFTYYAHTLMDGDQNALKAILNEGRTMSQADFLAAMNAAAAEKPLELNAVVTITSDVTLTTTVIVRHGGSLTVKSGKLTIPEGCDLATEIDGEIVIDGGFLHNENMLAANRGSIRILTANGYTQSENAKVDRWFYVDTGLSEIEGIELAQQTIRSNVETADQLQGVNGIENVADYDRVVIDVNADMSLMTYTSYPNTIINVVGGHTVTIPAGAIVTNNGDLFVHDNAELIVEGILNNQKRLFVSNKFVEPERSSGIVTVSVGGKLTNNGQMNIHDRVVVRGEVVNNAGIFMTADEASFVTEGGMVTNNGHISTEATKATIDFTYGGYVHGSKAYDDFVCSAELISDYFADGSTSNVKVSDMSKVTLRYVVTDMVRIDSFKAAAESYGNYILAFQEDTEIPAGAKLVIDQGSYLLLKPGKTLTNNGSIFNKGTMYLDETNNLVNNGTLENNPGAVMSVNGDYSGEGKVYVGLMGDGSMSVPTGIDKDQITILTGINGHVDPAAHLKMAAALDITEYARMEINLFQNVTIQERLMLTGGNNKVLIVHDGATLTIAEGATLHEGRVEVRSGGKIQVNGEYIVPNTQVKSGAAFNIGTTGQLKINNRGFTTENGSTLTNYGIMDNSSFGAHEMAVNGTYQHGKNALIMTQKDIEGLDTQYQTLVVNISKVGDISELADKVSGYAGCYAVFKSGALTIDTAVTIPAGMNLKIDSANLIVAETGTLTVDGTLTICSAIEGETCLTNSGTVAINSTGVLANYNTIYNNSGAKLTINGTMEPYGNVVHAENAAMDGTGSFSGSCGTGLTWKLSGTTLTISGEGAMESAPWNDLAFITGVQTVKLSSKLTSIADNAFASCAQNVSIVIPRAVNEIGDGAFAANANVKVYHNSPAEEILKEKDEFEFAYIHEINTDDGGCMVDGCGFNVSEMLNIVNSESATVDEKVEAVTGMDTTALKEQIKKELETDDGSNDVQNAIAAVEQELAKDKDLTVGVQSDSSVIGVVSQDAIVGALLSASEDTDKVTLVVSDTESVPKVLDVDKEFSANNAVPFEMTLEGVDDPENLEAPVTVTLPIPEILWGKNIVVIHHSFLAKDGYEVIYPKIVGRTATFPVDCFSDFEYREVAVAYVDREDNTFETLQAAIDSAQINSTVTLLTPFEGTGIIVNKPLTIVTSEENTLPANKIYLAEGFKLISEDGMYKIVETNQISAKWIQMASSLFYNATEQNVLLKITDGSKVLVEGQDYTVAGNKATNAGHYTMTVTGIGEYGGELQFAWNIAPAKIQTKVQNLETYYGVPYEIQHTEILPGFAQNAEVAMTYSFQDGNGKALEADPVDAGEYTFTAEAKVMVENAVSENYIVDVTYAGETGNLSIKPAEIDIKINHEIRVKDDGKIPAEACQITMLKGEYTDALFEEIGVVFTGDTSALDASYEISTKNVFINNSDNYEVKLSGTVTIGLGDYVCKNVQTGEYYTDLSDALMLVKGADDETIQMMKPVEEEFIIVTSGTTLDLNGLTVAADLVIGFNGSHVVDDSEDNAGRLVAAKNAVELAVDNNQIPIYSGTEYLFTNLVMFQEVYQNNGTKYVHLPTMEHEVVDQYLSDGGTDNNFNVVIRMDWAIGTGTAYQNFVYNDTTVGDVYSSWNDAKAKYGKVFNADLANSKYAEFEIKVILTSGTGVEYKCN